MTCESANAHRAVIRCPHGLRPTLSGSDHGTLGELSSLAALLRLSLCACLRHGLSALAQPVLLEVEGGEAGRGTGIRNRAEVIEARHWRASRQWHQSSGGRV